MNKVTKKRSKNLQKDRAVQKKKVQSDRERSQQTKRGVVIKKSGDKTVAVECIYTRTHPIYEKKYKIKRRYLVSDPENQARLGEEVVIRECKPKSKRKRWELTKDKK